MAQDDYFVIVYQVLKYLYECLKKRRKTRSMPFDSSTRNHNLEITTSREAGGIFISKLFLVR